MISHTYCQRIAKVPQTLRDHIEAGPSDNATHEHFLQLPCFQVIEHQPLGRRTPLPETFRVAAWNMERCLDVENSAQLLGALDADVILLSEMDCGMSRTGQRHTTQALAHALNMHYAYGVEFLELSLGSNNEQAFVRDSFNEFGFHGNAILSKSPIVSLSMLRFDNDGRWFGGQKVGNDVGQRRVGGRMALVAQLQTASNSLVTVASTHLESNANVKERDAQVRELIQHTQTVAPQNSAIIIGGDLNTGNNLPDGQDHNAEVLFESARSMGFDWHANAQGTTTRPSRLTERPERTMKLDWFCSKHVSGANPRIIPALDTQQQPLSDHDLIAADFSLTSTSVT